VFARTLDDQPVGHAPMLSVGTDDH
jgi:hypothetical protein